MIAIGLTILRHAWPFIVGALVWWWADAGWCNKACERQKAVAEDYREKFVALDRERIRREERTAQLNAAEELRAKEQDAKRKRDFAAARSNVDSTYRGISLSDGTKRMLGDAYSAAVGSEAARQPETAAPADTAAATLADWAKWSVDMLEWASVCRDRVDAWERWYRNNQEGQL